MSNAIIPLPETNVTIRAATLADVPFIDSLQKNHRKQLGFMRTSWIEAKIAAGQVLVAPSLGYVISTDRYFKRDDCGIVYQMCVTPESRRGLVAATLLKAVFDRAAYGCRLFCCWCAQDLEANRFWEAMGFVPIAYRAGSEKKGRVHIFWQKRIRAGDVSTDWWFPAKTESGAMRADRIALPIPPGVRWWEEMPVLLPQEKSEVRRLKSEVKAKKVIAPVCRQFGGPEDEPVVATPVPVDEKKTREKKPKAKADPKLVAAARELRDRWLEQVNAGEYVFEDAGKYEVSRALPEGPVSLSPTLPFTPAPARLLTAA